MHLDYMHMLPCDAVRTWRLKYNDLLKFVFNNNNNQPTKQKRNQHKQQYQLLHLNCMRMLPYDHSYDTMAELKYWGGGGEGEGVELISVVES